MGDMAVYCADYAKAATAYREALALSPDDSFNLTRKLALVLPTQDQAIEAEKLLSQMLEEKAKDLAAVATMTWLIWRAGKKEVAKWVEKSRALIPADPDPWAAGIEVMLDDFNGLWQTAVSGYQRIDQPVGAALASVRLGDHCLERGEGSDALERYVQAADIWAKSGDGDCGLALAYYRQAEVHWRMQNQEAAQDSLSTARSLLTACPSPVQKEGRKLVLNALKNIADSQLGSWSNWHWRYYDDRFRIPLLFRS
jgi:tetratricopeptide (TPR) repeat protein